MESSTPSNATLLVVDKDENLSAQIRKYFTSQPVEVLFARSGSEARSICGNRKPDVVLIDQLLSDTEGTSLFSDIFDSNHEAKIISMTVQPTFDGAVKAFRSGASDYLVKNFESEEFHQTIIKAVQRSNGEKEKLIKAKIEIETHPEETVIIGKECLAETLMLVERAATVDSPVLITGETGTGKNKIAGAIHFKSAYRKSAFVSINCASLPENLMESELFGFEKGAFTGAFNSHRGILEMAEGSTLFLDEIGEIPIHLQAKLLGVLEDKIIRRLGSSTTRPINFRIIASTSLPLEEVLGNTFRKDLYYRLNVIRIHLPPLRERAEDIPDLCDYFFKKIAPRMELRIPEKELATLKDYDWPGNIRELKNVLERSFIIQKGPELRPSRLLFTGTNLNSTPVSRFSSTNNNLLSLMEMERNHIKNALESRHGNCTQTAKLLGISLSTLKRKLKEYGLRVILLLSFLHEFAAFVDW